MKMLQKEFTANYDKCGNHKFTQIRKENGVAIYKRTRPDGSLKGYEVFIVKTRKKGDKLPGGLVEKEDRECYPGAAAFGRHAYDCKTEDSAEERFEELVRKVKGATVEPGDVEDTEGATTKPVKAVAAKGRQAKAKADIKAPAGRWTMKMLVAETGLTQGYLHPRVKQMLTDGLIREVERVNAGGRGRPSVIYETVG